MATTDFLENIFFGGYQRLAEKKQAQCRPALVWERTEIFGGEKYSDVFERAEDFLKDEIKKITDAGKARKKNSG